MEDMEAPALEVAALLETSEVPALDENALRLTVVDLKELSSWLDMPEVAEDLAGSVLEEITLLEDSDTPSLEESWLVRCVAGVLLELVVPVVSALEDVADLVTVAELLDIPDASEVIDGKVLDIPVFVSPGVLILLDPIVFEDEPIELACVPLLMVEDKPDGVETCDPDPLIVLDTFELAILDDAKL